LDWIRSQCRELYGDTLSICDHVLGDEEAGDVDVAEGDEDDAQDQEDVDADGESVLEKERGNADNNELPYDPELLDIWIESKGGILRLASRRSKNPLVLSEEVKARIMAGIAEYMDPEQYLSFEVFRDPSNYPELS
jgi:hypothetical protein